MAAKKLTASPVGLSELQLNARTEAASFYLRGRSHLETDDPIDLPISQNADHIPSPDVRSRIDIDPNRFDTALNDLHLVLKKDPHSERYPLQRSDLCARLGGFKSAGVDATFAPNRNKNEEALSIGERSDPQPCRVLILVLDKLDPAGIRAESTVPEVDPSMSSATATKKSKKKPSGNREGEMMA